MVSKALILNQQYDTVSIGNNFPNKTGIRGL